METVVNYNAAEQTATVYTRDKSVMRRLDRLVADYPDTYKLLKQTDIELMWKMQIKRVVFGVMYGRCFYGCNPLSEWHG